MSAENTRDYYRQQGAEAEREQIIELLSNKTTDCDISYLPGLVKAIELIKEEK